MFLLFAAYSRASRVPNQAGKIKRICVQAKTHGIALKFFMFFDFFLLLGLEPINNFFKIFCGVTVLKY